MALQARVGTTDAGLYRIARRMQEPGDPLDEAYDPLDERAVEPCDQVILVGAGDEGVAGFGAEVLDQTDRANRLVAMVHPPIGAKDPASLKRRKRIFLMALAETGIVSFAAARAGWNVSSTHYHRKRDEAFAAAFDEALEVAADRLELAAVQRAVHGTLKPVWDRGGKERDPGIVGYETVYSDPLLALLLKARRPEKFRERHDVNHSGDAGGGVLLVPTHVPIDEWSAAAAKQQERFREKREDD